MQVFHNIRASIPDIHLQSMGFPSANSGILTFDSLKSLPTDLPATTDSYSTICAAAPKLSVDATVLQAAAHYLKQQFGLSLFGFDVVIGSDDGIYYIIDVNYFPNYKADGAEVWFRQAIKGACINHRA